MSQDLYSVVQENGPFGAVLRRALYRELAVHAIRYQKVRPMRCTLHGQGAARGGSAELDREMKSRKAPSEQDS